MLSLVQARVRLQAEKEGLDKIFINAGLEWRFAGCSMCLGMNDDQLKKGERCASSSNRNFEGRQGPGGRTHLMSPQMAALAALEGKITDIRKFEELSSLCNHLKPYRHCSAFKSRQRRHGRHHP